MTKKDFFDFKMANSNLFNYYEFDGWHLSARFDDCDDWVLLSSLSKNNVYIAFNLLKNNFPNGVFKINAPSYLSHCIVEVHNCAKY